MLSAVISFLGGSAFRMIWGEVSAYLNKRQEHRYELDRMRLQNELEDKAHVRTLENLRLQNELGVKMVEVQRDAEIMKMEADAWAELAKSTTKKTGIWLVDAWNASIRPFLATMAIVVVVIEVCTLNGVLNNWHRDLVSVILGIYVADRSLLKRGK